MTESAAAADLRRRGIWRIAPGLWCDRTEPGLIAVALDADTAWQVRAALKQAGQLPEVIPL